MRRRVYLLRHSDVDYYSAGALKQSPDEAGLTPLGRRQALAAGRALRGVPFDRVVTSGLRRTEETAALVLDASQAEHRPDIEACPELIEIRGGAVTDVPEEELEEAFLGIWRGVAPPEATFLGGERIGEFVDRVVPAFDRLVAAPAWHTMLLVLHGAVNRALLSHALTGERVFLGHLEQGTACINILDLDPAMAVRATNITPYDLVHRESRISAIEHMYRTYQRTRGLTPDR